MTKTNKQFAINEKSSLLRPAWTQDNLHAYRDLHTRDGVVKDHFVKTQGFRTKADAAKFGSKS